MNFENYIDENEINEMKEVVNELFDLLTELHNLKPIPITYTYLKNDLLLI